MGSTGTASVSQPSTGYFNPASLAWADGVALTAEYQDFGRVDDEPFLDFTDVRLAAGKRLGDGWRVGGLVGYSNMDWSVQNVRTIYVPEGTGETVDGADWYVTALAAAAYSHGVVSVALGVAGKYLSIDYADANAFLLDLGAIVALEFEPGGAIIRPRAGVSVSNLDDDIEVVERTYDIEGETRVGLGFDLASDLVWWMERDVRMFRASVDLDFVNPAERFSIDGDYHAVGFEVSGCELLYARFGAEDSRLDKTTFGFGLGWTFDAWWVRADYAHESREVGILGGLEDNAFGVALGRAW
jgi:hypothetical protein